MTNPVRALLALATTIVAALALAACGSTSAGSGADTAKLAPPATFFYAEAAIDPSGDQQTAMRSILGDLPGAGPPEQRLNNLIEQASKKSKSGNLDYQKDIKPWLGDKASVFVAAPKAGAGTPPWAVVVATSDEGKAKAAINKGRESTDRKLSYRGADYVVSKDKTAVGTVDGFLVIGSQNGIKAAIDASKDQSLSSTDRYKQAVARASTDRVALVYEDLGGLIQAAAGAGGQSLGAAAPLVGRLFGGKPVVATVRAEQQALVIDGSLFPSTPLLKISGAATPLLGQVPSDAWLTFGLSNFGAELKSLIGLVSSAAGGEQALEQQIKAASGLDLQKDVLSWIGDVAFFVSGDSKATLGGGALIKSTNPAASRAALGKLARLLAKTSAGTTVAPATIGGASGYRISDPSAPRGIYMLQSGSTVALTYGDAAAKAVGGGGAGLTSSAAFKNAASNLGGGYAPSFYASFAPILRLAESFGASSASYQKAKQYLTILDYVIAGSTHSGSGIASRLRIGFKPHD